MENKFKFKSGDIIIHKATGEKAVIVEFRQVEDEQDSFCPKGQWYFLSTSINDLGVRHRVDREFVELVFKKRSVTSR